MLLGGTSQADHGANRGIALSCVLSTALLSLNACAPSTSHPSSASEPSARAHKALAPLAVIVSGDTAGWIMPCGCTANQSGGLPGGVPSCAARGPIVL